MMRPFKKQLYGLNLPHFEAQLETSYLKTEELSYTTVDDGIILPTRTTDLSKNSAIYEGGVCDKELNFVAGYKRYARTNIFTWEAVRAYQPTEEIRYIDEEVIFAGIAFAQFGHFFVESFSRMWWVVQNKIFDKKIVFIKNKPFDAGFLVLLEIMGIKKENIIYLDKPTQFKKVYIPDQALWFHSFYYKEFTLPYEEMRNNVVPANYKKIYLSRTQFVKKDCINEEYFEDFYRGQGYHIVYPEQLTLREQISIVSGADEIVCTIGTISHLALFAKKEARLVILLRSLSSLNIPQVIINQAKELNAVFVDVTCNFLPNRHSAYCFYIGPNEMWKRFVRDEYGIEITTTLKEHLNSDKSRIGEYFKLWLNIYQDKSSFSKIRTDNAATVLDLLQAAFTKETQSYPLLSKEVEKQILAQDNLAQLLATRIFYFSRYDNSHKRIIYLAGNGEIHTINGNGNRNEAYWAICNNRLQFKDVNQRLTSTYFHLDTEGKKIFAIGYYERNHAIIFKLEEILIPLTNMNEPPHPEPHQHISNEENENQAENVSLFSKLLKR